MKMSYIHIFGVSDREEREIRAETLFENMMTKSFLNFIIEKLTDSGNSVNSKQNK